MKAFSNEIKSQTFYSLWPGYCLFWLCKQNTTHKIPGTSAVYWVTWFVVPDCDKTSEKRKAEIEVFGINFILKMFIEIKLI